MQSQTTSQCALFEHLRSRQFLSMLPRAVSLQVMHPAISAALMEIVARFRGPLSPAERSGLYDRCRHWYGVYGISTAPVPETVEEFDDYFVAATSELTVTPALTRYSGQLLRYRQWWPAAVPTGAIRTFLQPAAARALGVRVSAADRVVASAFTSMAPLR